MLLSIKAKKTICLTLLPPCSLGPFTFPLLGAPILLSLLLIPNSALQSGSHLTSPLCQGTPLSQELLLASTLRARPRLLPPSCSSHLCAPCSWRTAGFNKDVRAEDSEIPRQDLQACLCRMLPPSHPVWPHQRPAPLTNSTVTALAGHLLALPLLSLGLPSLQMSQAIVLSTHHPTRSLPSVLLPLQAQFCLRATVPAIPATPVLWLSLSIVQSSAHGTCSERLCLSCPAKIASLSFPSAPPPTSINGSILVTPLMGSLFGFFVVCWPGSRGPVTAYF